MQNRTPSPSLLLVLLAFAGCASSPKAAPPSAEAPVAAADATPSAALALSVVDAADRDEADRALDAGRKPAELLAFAEVRPGMRVADLAAGGGYTSELLARAVGPTGKVYSQNVPFVVEKFAAKPWSARLAKPVMKDVVRVEGGLEAPLPVGTEPLDLVTNVLFYHDTVWLKVDRAKMNAAIFAALRPGGLYVVVDHSARAGTGVADAQTNHRIEESVVVSEIVSAGFVLEGEGGFLRNPSDTRDWNDAPNAAGERRGMSDRFALKFRKPK